MNIPIQHYLKQNIDSNLVLKPWPDSNKIPIFLRETYHLYSLNMLETECILLKVIDDTPDITEIQKHTRHMNQLTKLPIVLMYQSISRYRRKSLIANRIPFVIEDGQMYLPFLGLDLQKVPEDLPEHAERFSTPAQMAFLYFLYHPDSIINTTEFAGLMNFNLMTASRALNELYRANLVTYTIGGKTGRSKNYQRISDPDFFFLGRTYLKSPISTIVYSKTKPSAALLSGLDALAELSHLNPPDHPTLAVDKKLLDQENILIINNRDLIRDEKLVQLELWDFDPRLFSDKQHVDLASLYASLKDQTDERIQSALEEALKGEPWYMD